MKKIICGVTERAIPESFVYVEGGTFQMENCNDYDAEKPILHSVTVSSFYMARYQVTQKEWQEVMGTTIRQQRDIAENMGVNTVWQKEKGVKKKSLPLYGEGDNYPMYYVSWYDAAEYCNSLSIKEGLIPVYQGYGDSITFNRKANSYRLPTKAEWEYAAKGGNKSVLTGEYSGSNSADEIAWYEDNSGDTNHPVGTKAPNELGIYDMSGNIGEWVYDRYGSYGRDSQTDPMGASSGSRRVVSSGVIGHKPFFRSVHIGFRLVR